MYLWLCYFNMAFYQHIQQEFKIERNIKEFFFSVFLIPSSIDQKVCVTFYCTNLSELDFTMRLEFTWAMNRKELHVSLTLITPRIVELFMAAFSFSSLCHERYTYTLTLAHITYLWTRLHCIIRCYLIDEKKTRISGCAIS